MIIVGYDAEQHSVLRLFRLLDVFFIRTLAAARRRKEEQECKY
jgi:hypothetical protein